MSDKNKVQIDLVANPQELNPELQRAEKSINTFGQKITNIFNKISSSTSTIKDSIANSFINGAKSVKQFTDELNIAQSTLSTFNQIWYKSNVFLNSYIQRLNITIASHKRLALTNKLTGDSAGYSTQRLIEYSKYLELLTGYTHEATESAMQMIMHFRNIHGEEFIGATKAAQDLATALTMDLSSAASFVAESLTDPINAVQKLTQVNVFFTESEKKAIQKFTEAGKVIAAQNIILGKLEASFGGAAKAAGETFAGRMERLKNTLNRIGSEIGERVLNKLNSMIGLGEKGRKTFDAFLEKVNEWGKVAVAAVDILLPKILNFTKSLKFNFNEVYDWLLDQTIVVFSGVQAAYQNTAKILDDIGVFIYTSFNKIWGGVSLIFTDIIPKAYKYMVDVFVSLSEQIKNGFDILSFYIRAIWQRLPGYWEVFLHNLDASFIKWSMLFGLKISKFAINIGLKWIAWIPPVKNAINSFYNWFGKKIDEEMELHKRDYGLNNMFKDLQEDLSTLQNPFKDLTLPDFSTPINELGEAVDLTQQWDKLWKQINQHAGSDFQENIKENKKEFDKLVQDIKARSKELKDLTPDLTPDFKRREDERKKLDKSGEKFASGLTGLEELWRNMSSGSSPEVKAAEENTKAVEENTEELKKKSLSELRTERRTKFLAEQETKRKKKPEQEKNLTIEEKKQKEALDALNSKEAKLKRLQEFRLAEAQRRFERKVGMKAGTGTVAFNEDLKAHEGTRDVNKDEKKEALQERRDKIHNEMEAKRQRQRGFSDAIKKRMRETGETYVKARRNIEGINNRNNSPAEELARQKSNENEIKQERQKQHKESEKHLKDIAGNTRKNVEETKAVKENTAKVVNTFAKRNIV